MTIEPGTPTTIAALSPEWHELRRTRICATDWPKILLRPEQWSGLPFGSPLSVWEKLTGKRVESGEDFAHLRWGRYMEASHAEWLADEAGIGFERCAVSWTRGDRFEASPDGFVSKADRKRGQGELKAPTPWSDDWEDAAPLQYQVQTQGGMWVTGCDWGVVSCLRFPGPPKYQVIEYDARNVERWLDMLNDWWERYVAKDIPPAATGSERDRKILGNLRPETGRNVTMPADIVDLCTEIDDVAARAKQLNGREDALKNSLRQWMIEHQASKAVDPAGAFAWTYKASGLRRGKP